MLSIDELLTVVSEGYRERFNEIVTMTDAFCDQHLNDEYKKICRKMAVMVCLDESPVLRGKAASWACGLVYAVGWVNFLTDPSQTPHLKSGEIAAGFGVSTGTMQAKHREIRDLLDLTPFDPRFTVPSLVEENPLIWMVQTSNGFILDIRHAPREVQVAAYEQGLIPYVPADR